ncbi:MAG: hypothetical protein F9K42_02395 [Ignavibacterium sp.]|jgi:hypothetical protein|nr:MAG: hypothetical protein F9K42_02395 [Ignavibacterium sp.]MCZ7616640.1 hypothetical protein [Ignavibacteriaceae bacterium]MDX9713317.1 hypothetical protein [Ignavibacteriaceae bacterium]
MEELLQVLEKISTLFGPIYGTIFFILLAGLAILLYFFHKRIENISEEISNKALSKFDKKIELLFRDEVIRSSLRIQLAQDSIKKKLEFYEKVYSLYFEYQKSWSYTDKTPNEEINELYNKILRAREDIFVNSIYLGGFLTDKLIKVVVNMHADLRRKITQIKNRYAKVETTDYIMILLDEIENARKWLIENVFPDQTLKEFEFTKEQINTLNEEKKKLLEGDDTSVS